MNTKRRWHAGLHSLLALVLALALLPSGPGVVQVQAQSADLFFSEYIEGTSNNKALEIFNNTGAPVDLAAGGYNVQMFFNGSASAGLTINLTGTVAHGDVFVLAHSSANAAILAQADQTNGAGWYNGDDAVVLRKGTDVIDSIGQAGFDPGTEWGSGLTSTADNTLRRKANILAGDTNPSDVFDPAVEWDGFATDTFDGLGSHTVDGGGGPTDQAPAVTSTSPANGATEVPVDQNITVSFSEDVNLADPWFTLSCTLSGAVSAAISGGPNSYLLDPNVDLQMGETCTLTVLSSAVTDVDADDPPDSMLADVIVSFTTVMPVLDYCVVGAPYVTPIPAVQGTGDVSPLADSAVTVRGVVVGDYEGPSPTLRGFYIQDPVGDGDPLTSDGVFVFNFNNDSVALGSLVAVTGRAVEFQGQTQLDNVSSIEHCGEGSVAPVEVTLPVPSLDYLERYEGMLVTLPQTLYVTEHFQLGRFGQVVLSSGGRLAQPTNVTAPGAPALALQAQNNLNRIILDDTLNNQNPDPIVFGRGGLPLTAENTLRGGDTITGLTGVLTYTWAGNAASGNAYRVRPVSSDAGPVNFEAANPRPETPAGTGGRLDVAALNVLNYFNTFDGSSTAPPWACNLGVGGPLVDCRGADDLTEFERQHVKTVAAILAMDPAVLGVIEIENDGYGPDSALATLVNGLNDIAGAGTYAFIDADAGTGQVNALGTDAIKVGLLYQPARVSPVGTTAALNSVEFVNGGDGAERNRPALAQAFQTPDGGVFVAVVNHFKSKSSACDIPDAFDGQGNCNLVRVNAAMRLAEWLAADPTGTGDPDVLIVGDLNAYAKEDPITTLQNFGYANLIESFLGPDAYSYVFDGQWGYLDHALASPSLAAQVSGVVEYHINADEPSVLDYNTNFKSAGQIASLFAPDQYRVSDHDPVIVGLNLLSAAPAAGQITVSPNPQRAGAPVTASLTFSDPDPGDTHTVLFDWGDGTTSAGVVTESGGAGSASGSHSYAAPGLYTLTATVTDLAGSSDSAVFQYVVIYNPNSFVTGGGWIATADGRLGFDFSAKYQKNHAAPIGSFSMALDGGGFRFQSSGFDWLVVDGSLAYLHGTGALNGQDGYTYMITALDGSPDRVRFQVWDAGGSVVFDTQPGDGFTAAPTTALGGGKITIR